MSSCTSSHQPPHCTRKCGQMEGLFGEKTMKRKKTLYLAFLKSRWVILIHIWIWQIFRNTHACAAWKRKWTEMQYTTVYTSTVYYYYSTTTNQGSSPPPSQSPPLPDPPSANGPAFHPTKRIFLPVVSLFIMFCSLIIFGTVVHLHEGNRQQRTLLQSASTLHETRDLVTWFHLCFFTLPP